MITAGEIGLTFVDIGNITKNAVRILIGAVGVLSFVFLVIGGIKYTASGGDKAQVESARLTITYAIVGVSLAAIAYAVAILLESILGIGILNVAII